MLSNNYIHLTFCDSMSYPLITTVGSIAFQIFKLRKPQSVQILY